MANTSASKRFGTWLGAGIFLWSAWYLYAKVEWPPVVDVLMHANFSWLILGGGAMALAYFALRTLRLHFLARRVNASVRYWDLYVVTAVILAFSDMTPGKLGEGLKIEMLKRLGVLGRMEGAGAFLVERVSDLLVIAALGVLSLFAASRTLPVPAHTPEILVLTIVVCIAAFWLFLKSSALERLKLPAVRLRAVVSDRSAVVTTLVLSACSWLAVAVAWQLSLRSVAVELSLAQSVWLVCVTGLVQIATFVPGGLGIAEVVISETLELYGVPRSDAVAGAIMLRCYGLLVIAFGLLHWLPWKRMQERESIV